MRRRILVAAFCALITGPGAHAAQPLADNQLDSVRAGIMMLIDGMPAMLCMGCTTTATATTVTVVTP